MGQAFGDTDLKSIEPGRAVVGRRTGGAGVVELIELDADGLTSAMIREQGDYLVANIAIPGVSPLRLRQAWEEGLYKPGYLPAAKSILLTASGEVWLTTFERSDTLEVYYAVRRGDMTGQPRRVLLPESFLASRCDGNACVGDLEGFGGHAVRRDLLAPRLVLTSRWNRHSAHAHFSLDNAQGCGFPGGGTFVHLTETLPGPGGGELNPIRRIDQ